MSGCRDRHGLKATVKGGESLSTRGGLSNTEEGVTSHCKLPEDFSVFCRLEEVGGSEILLAT